MNRDTSADAQRDEVLPLLAYMSVGRAILNFSGFTCLVPLVPEMAGDLRVSSAMAGLILSSFAVGQVFATPTWGYLTDKLGARRAACESIISAAALLAGLCCFFFSCMDSAWSLVIARFLWGMSSGDLGVVQGYLAMVSTSRTLPYAMTLYAMSGPLGTVMSPFWSGQMSSLGYRDVVAIYGVLNCSLGSLIFIIAQVNKRWKERNGGFPRSLLRLSTSVSLAPAFELDWQTSVVLLAFALETSAYSCFQALLAVPLAVGWSYGPVSVGHVFAVSTIACLACQLCGTRIAMRILGIPAGLVLFPLLAALSALCMILFSGVPFVPFAFVPGNVLFVGMCHPFAGVLVSTRTHISSRARAFSLSETGGAVGRLSGSFLASVLLPWGIWFPTAAACAQLLIAALVLCPVCCRADSADECNTPLAQLQISLVEHQMLESVMDDSEVYGDDCPCPVPTMTATENSTSSLSDPDAARTSMRTACLRVFV